MKCQSAVEKIRLDHNIDIKNPRFTSLLSENQIDKKMNSKETREQPIFISPIADPKLVTYYLDEFDKATQVDLKLMLQICGNVSKNEFDVVELVLTSHMIDRQRLIKDLFEEGEGKKPKSKSKSKFAILRKKVKSY